MTSDWENKTEQELVDLAHKGHTALGPTVEMMRRLMNALVEQHRSTNRLTRWIIGLTWVIVALGVIQIVLSIKS